MLDANISSISFSASKTFLGNYLFDDYKDGTMEFLKGEQLEQIHEKFYELSSPNIRNLITFFKRQEVAILITYLN